MILLLSILITTPVRGASLPSPRGIWLTQSELDLLPASGPSWENLAANAALPAGTPDLGKQHGKDNVLILAKALVYAKTREKKYRQEVIKQCMKAIGTEQGGYALGPARNITAYVVAADLVGLPPAQDRRFKNWLRSLLSEELRGKSIRSTHERRPNNWGTAAGAARTAIALYLDDRKELHRAAMVFRAWLGEGQEPVSFRFKHVEWWQADPTRPKGINPKGARKAGHSIDGVLPEEMRRAGPFKWPPPRENYVWTALQGAIVQAVLLERAGYPAFTWGDKALLRAYKWLYEVADYPAAGDDTWQMPLVDFYYGTRFWTGEIPRKCGKIMCWTDWTHGTRIKGQKAADTLEREKRALKLFNEESEKTPAHPFPENTNPIAIIQNLVETRAGARNPNRAKSLRSIPMSLPVTAAPLFISSL